jgi:general secretion pathway protein D
MFFCALAMFLLTPQVRAQTRPATAPATFTLNFKDAPLDAVLSYFSQTIGFEILKDGPVDARVTMMSKQPVSAEEAVTMLTAALRVNGFSVIREDHLLRISSLDKAKKGNVPVHLGANWEDVPNTDELITQIIPLENISASKLRDDLKPLLSSDTDMTSNDGSNTIIVTDVASRVRLMVEMISQIDLHEAQTSEVRIIPLKHASATAIAKLLDSLFKPQTNQPQQPNPFMPQPPQQPQQPEKTSQRHGESVVTAADDRTNTLLVVASSQTLKTIDEIVAHLDSDAPNPASTTQTRVYTLKFADAEETAKIINTVFSAPKNGPQLPILFIDIAPAQESNKEIPTNAVADDRTNSVVVTAPLERLAQVDELIQRLDTSPMSGVELRSIHLKNADAENSAKLLQDMFIPKKEEQAAPQLEDFLFRQAPAEQKERNIKISINADERTNILFISAPHEWLDMIEGVAREIDAENTTEDVLFIYHLRNAQAAHLEYTLNVLFGNNQAPQPQNNEQNNQNQQNMLAQQQQQNGLGQRSTSMSPNNPGSPTNTNNRNNQNQPRSATLPPGVTRATSELTGNVLVVAEPDTNSLLVTTSRKFEDRVRGIITELDRPVPQVLIKCLVAEVTHENINDFGVDFSVLNLRANGNGQIYSNTVGAAAAAASTAMPGGFVVKVLESNVTAVLQALAQQNKLDVLSRPYILTSDNQEAGITVGDEVPFVTDSFTDVNGGVHNTVQYQDLGVILDVTPHINPDGLVVMDIDPEISSLTGETVTIQAGVSVPVYELRSAQSRVAIQDGQTIVIGGLMQDQKTEQINKIPILGDIPLLGAIFSYRSRDKKKTELLIFLTPHAVMEPGSLQGQSEDEVGELKLTPGAVQPGTIQQQMRGMARGSTTEPSAPLVLPSPAPASPGDSW